MPMDPELSIAKSKLESLMTSKPVRAPIVPRPIVPHHPILHPIGLKPVQIPMDDLSSLLPDSPNSSSGGSPVVARTNTLTPNSSILNADFSNVSQSATHTNHLSNASTPTSSATPISSGASSPSASNLSSTTPLSSPADSVTNAASSSSSAAQQTLLNSITSNPAVGTIPIAKSSITPTVNLNSFNPVSGNTVLSQSPFSNTTNPNTPTSMTASGAVSSVSASNNSYLTDYGTRVILPDGSSVGVIGDPTSLEAPISTPNTATTQTPSIMSMIGSYGGSISGILQLLDHWSLQAATNASSFGHSAATAISNLFTPLVENILAGVTVGLSAYSLWTGLQGMFEDGFSIGGIINIGMSIVGLGLGLTTLITTYGSVVLAGEIAAGTAIAGDTAASIPLLFGLAAGPLAWIVVAAIVAAMVILAFLLSVKPNTTPSAIEQPLAQFPTVWATGAVLTITLIAGLTAVGVNLSQKAPATQTLTIPHDSIKAALDASGLQSASGSNVASGSYSPYTSVFVKPGEGTLADQVVIVSPSGMTHMDTVNVYTLKNNMRFAAPTSPNAAYIPFFITGPNGQMIANPDVITALKNEIALSQAAIALSNPVAQQDSAAANKGVTSSYN